MSSLSNLLVIITVLTLLTVLVVALYLFIRISRDKYQGHLKHDGSQDPGGPVTERPVGRHKASSGSASGSGSGHIIGGNGAFQGSTGHANAGPSSAGELLDADSHQSLDATDYDKAFRGEPPLYPVVDIVPIRDVKLTQGPIKLLFSVRRKLVKPNMFLRVAYCRTDDPDYNPDNRESCNVHIVEGDLGEYSVFAYIKDVSEIDLDQVTVNTYE